MILSYVYKLRPSPSQSRQMARWLDMLRSHYNWCLADRIATYYQQFIQGEYCDIRTRAVASPLTCCIVKGGATGDPWKRDGKRRNAGLIQDAQLPELKKARPWYKDIAAEVLQQNLRRLNDAYANFFSGRGFPRFKNRSTFRSFAYPPGKAKIVGNRISFPKLGEMRFYNSRPLPDGFSIRSVTIRQKQDGWYVSIKLEDKAVPDFSPMPVAEIRSVVGLDVGITKLVHCSDGTDVDNPRFATNPQTQRCLKIRQRRVSRKQKGSNNRGKAAKQVGKLHQRIANQREAHQWQTASQIAKKADCIAVEDLNIKGMKARCKPKPGERGRFLSNGQSAKRALNRAISDAAWGELIEKMEYAAAKSGKVFIKVNPRHSSQECSACGHVDKDNRNREKFICTSCGHLDHADKQAARNIRQRGIEALGIEHQIQGTGGQPETVRRKSANAHGDISSPSKGKRAEPGNPKGKQLSLFDWDVLAAM